VITPRTVGNVLTTTLASNQPITVTLTGQYAGQVQYLDPAEADLLADFPTSEEWGSSRGPRGVDSALKPDITAPGVNIFSAEFGSGNQGFTLSGTSMATPHVTGVMALLRELHPTWTVEELKALAMNTANHDLYTGLNRTGLTYDDGRTGAGRVDAAQASQSDVVAYNAGAPGVVGVSFGALEVEGTGSWVRRISVVNQGTSAMTYGAGFTNVATIPGVSYAVAPTEITVPAFGVVTVGVTLTADASLMTHTSDATFHAGSASDPNPWISEATGFVVLTPVVSGGARASVAGSPAPTLRVPVYATARPVSEMGAQQSELRFGASPTIVLSGTSVLQKAGTASDASLVWAFELQALHDADVTGGAAINSAAIHYVGVTSNFASAGTIGATSIYFGLSAWGRWSTPQDVEYDVNIDTTGDGQADYTLFNWDQGSVTEAYYPSDFPVDVLYNDNSGQILSYYPLNVLSAAQANTVPFNNDSMVFGVPASVLGLSAGHSAIRYQVSAYTNFEGAASADQSGLLGGQLVDQTGWMAFDPAAPGLSFGGQVAASPGSPGLVANGVPAYYDVPAGGIPVSYSLPDYVNQASLGLLLIHSHNAAGSHGEVVNLDMWKDILPFVSR
jgi:hypothetical protein